MNTIITIGREFGSGGHRVGRLVAEKLGIPCYDRELMVLAAERAGMSPSAFSQIDETATSSFLYAVTTGSYTPTAFQTMGGLPLNDKLFISQTEVIREKAEEGACVFVGRCADYILREYDPILRVFIRADLPFRVDRIMEAEECSEKEAVDIITRADKRRAKYYNFYTQKRWGMADSYDLMLNNAKFGIEASAELICNYAQALSD